MWWIWSMGLALAADWPSIDEPLRTGQSRPNEAAVVVGNESYPFLTPVPYAKRDAQAFRNFLLYTRGIPQENIVYFEGANKGQMEEAIRQALGKVGQDGVLWFYYAGHGAADPNTGERVLVGDGAKAGTLASDGLALSQIERLSAEKNIELFSVVDACYNGASRNGTALTDQRFVVPQYHTSEASHQVTQWLAVGPDQLSNPLDPVQHGAFTYFALGALRGWADGEISGKADGIVTYDEAQAYVTRSLEQVGERSQTPVLVRKDATLSALNQSKSLEKAPDLTDLALETQNSEPVATASSPVSTPPKEASSPTEEEEEPIKPKVTFKQVMAGLAETVLDAIHVELEEDKKNFTSRRDILESVEYKMIRLSSGSFDMGSPISEVGRGPDEGMHVVSITQPYWLGETEVTQGLWNEVMRDNPSSELGDAYPVHNISWIDVIKFCNRLSILEGLETVYDVQDGRIVWNREANGYRLPSEAEWEYAARAGQMGRFSGASSEKDVCQYANVSDLSREKERGFSCDDGYAGLSKVGSFLPNAWGFRDMTGNVAEWVWDIKQDYSQGKEIDPIGPENGMQRVFRGGSYKGTALYARVANRQENTVDFTEEHLGFRLARNSK